MAGAAAAPALLTSGLRADTPGCALTSEVTEGPYYVDRRLVRSDITENLPGVPLRLRILVLDTNRCAPLRQGAIDLWHCNASGVYSGYTKAALMGPPPGGRGPGPGRMAPPPFPPPGGDRRSGPGGMPPRQRQTDQKTFFRGVQITNDEGLAEFATIFPGWYMSRAIHIHLKVWVNGSAVDKRYDGGYTCHTGQLFFPEDLTADIARLAPYRDHQVERLTISDDNIFSEAGPNCVVKVTPKSARSLGDGLVATAVVGVNPLMKT